MIPVRRLVLIALVALGPLSARAESMAAIEQLLISGKPERVAAIRERIWSTPLGLMMNDYLFDDSTPNETTRRVHRLSSRMFSSAPLVLTRLSAMQIMVADLYERGMVSDRVHRRIGHLQTEIGLKRDISRERSTKSVIKMFPAITLFSIVSGSAIAREQTAVAFESVIAKIGFGQRARAAEALRLFEPEIQSLVRDRFFRDYSVGHALNIFLSTYASTAVVYYLFEDGAEEGAGLGERIWNYLLQSHTSLEYL